MAAIQGLSRSEENASVTVFTDSSYVINGITKWIHGWKRNDWKTKTKDDVLNKDLWIRLGDAVTKRKVTWEYVGGHVGIVGNERCDVIATSFADGEDIELYEGPLSGYGISNIEDVSHDDALMKTKKSGSSHSKAKAYSYVSSINGKIEIHKTWAECEKRVKGARGARYKKALSPTDEAAIKKEFGH
jgi:ribonuclease HI